MLLVKVMQSMHTMIIK